MDEGFLTFVREVREAVTFDAAADITLRAILTACEEAVAGSSFTPKARLLRAAVHVRPADVYRRIAAREVSSAPPGSVPYTHSASAWRWLQDRRRPIAIDVHLGTVQVHEGESFTVLHEETARPFRGKETRKKLLGRDATHLLVLPLRSSATEIAGMISLEADAQEAMGTPFVWPVVLPIAQALLDVAAPHLLALPSAPEASAPADPFLPVVGTSMRPVVEILRVFAQQEETVLLSGPTGTGKSRLARWCHEVSLRKTGPFEPVDLSTMPETLQMAELFGWKKGAFTGATKDTGGGIARAEGGTLFIDEIDKLSLAAQAGLLRVLEERRYRPLGDGGGDRSADVRFIVGTNVALLQKVREGTFREDLYYRIHVLPVRVPPLAERADEIAAWASFMLARHHARQPTNREATFSAAALEVLVAQGWPGNLRQLDNIVRRAYALFLAEAGPNVARLVLSDSHVKRGLLYEEGTDRKPFIELLQAAAVAFVAEAEKRRGAPLDLDLTDAFRGVVLAVAAQKLDSVEEAFKLFGKDSLVEHRNHMKALRKALSRVDALYEDLGAGPSPFTSLARGEE